MTYDNMTVENNYCGGIMNFQTSATLTIQQSSEAILQVMHSEQDLLHMHRIL